jgi:hypothetical protein
MATYRVIVHIECDDENVVRQLGQDYLEQLQDDPPNNDYLALYVEHEFAWMHQSFNRIDVQEIKHIEA